MKISTLPWLLVPGTGQIHQGRVVLGVLFFALFAVALNGYLLGPLLWPQPSVRTLSGIGSIILWVLSAVEYIVMEIRSRRPQRTVTPS